jgi:hypothetical protein
MIPLASVLSFPLISPFSAESIPLFAEKVPLFAAGEFALRFGQNQSLGGTVSPSSSSGIRFYGCNSAVSRGISAA